MLQIALPTPRVVLFLKAKIAHQTGYAKYGNPPRWHKISHDAPAPKGAPVAAHPHAGGQHEPAKHFTDEQWGQLKLPPENQNASSYNKLLDKLKEHSEAGDVTAILGMGFGINTYGKKGAAVANELLSLHGSQHKVMPGQGAGWHAAVEHHVPEAAPAASAPPAPPEPDATPAAETAEVKAAPSVQIGAVPVPEFSAKKDGVVEYYQAVVSKVLALAQAGDAEGLKAMVKPHMGTWGGKTPNSKKLMEYHGALLAQLQQVTPAAAAAEPATPAAAAMEKVQAKSVAQKLEGMSLNEKELVVGKALGKLFNDQHKATWAAMSDAQKEDAFEAVGAVEQMHGEMLASGLGAVAGKNKPLWSALPFPLQETMVQAASKFMPDASAPAAATGGGVVKMNGYNYKKVADARHGWQFEVGDNGGWHDVINTDVVKQLNSEHGAADTGPKDGDTKDGLVFKNGRWHKYVNADESGEVPPVLVPVTTAADHNGAAFGADDDLDTEEKALVMKWVAQGKWNLVEGLISQSSPEHLNSKAGQWIQGVLANKPKATTVGAPSVDPVAEAKPPAHALLDQIPWDKLVLPDTNTNAKSINPKLEKLKAAAYAGDVAGLEAMKFGLNTYNKKLAAVQATALAALAEAPAMGPAEPMAAGTSVNEPAADGSPVKPTFTSPTHTEVANTISQAMAEGDTDTLHDKWAESTGAITPEGKKLEAYAQAAYLHASANKPPPKAEPLSPVVTEMLDGMAAAGEWDQLADDMENAKNPEKKKYIARLLKQKPEPAASIDPASKQLVDDMVAQGDWAMVESLLTGAKKPGTIDYIQGVLKQKPAVFTVGEHPKVSDAYKKGIKQLADAGHWHKIEELFNAAGTPPHVHSFLQEVLSKKPGAAADTGPKEGDTKQGVGGTLVFHNGHWVLQGEPQYAKLMPKAAIALGSNLKTKAGNKAKLKKMAVDGDAAGLKQFLTTAPGPASKAYANKLLDAMQAKHAELFGAKPAGGIPAAPAAAAPAPTFTPPGGVIDLDAPDAIDHWKQVGPQGGSNPGGAFVDEDGVKWYCKFPANEDHAKSEVLAAKLYALAGVAAQDAKLVTKGGKVGIASKWEDVTAAPGKLAGAAGAQQGFVVDAWLANYDVVGPDFMNMQIGADGEAFRVDAGGSLEYRAQGKKKTDFGNTVKELASMRDPSINAATAKVFGSMTDADITASAKKVLSISDEEIIDLVMEHGPGDDLEKAALAEKLIARKNDIAKKYPKAMPKVVKKPKPDPTKLPVKASDIPNPPDFVGMKVSSKEHVNSSNAKDAMAIHDFAMKGNLVGLKDYHFDAIDKESGQSLGKKPIEQHPSKQVKGYWSDLVSALNFIANPPEELKLTTKIGGTVSKVSAVFKGAKYGVTTSTAAASSRLAFWIALGATKPALALLPKGATLDFTSSPKGQPGMTTALAEKAKADYAKLKPGSKVRAFINGIQSSGTYNDNFRDGKMVTKDGHDARQMVLDAYGYAQEKPEGFEVYKWMSMSPEMTKQLHSCPEGTVFQNPGSMCTSTDPNGTSGFGSHRMRIRYAPGAKAVDSFGSGAFKGEKEITTLPGQRFVILSCKEVQCPIKGKRTELDVLMLPPDPSYLAEIEASLKGV